jgi:phospho-N-acetylmuramoyl-pentapeptide-transferase
MIPVTGTRIAVIAAVAFVLVALLGTLTIPLLRRLKVGQRVRDDGPRTHLKKMGVPTMGGLFFAVPGLLLAAAWSPLDPAVRAAVLFSLVFCFVGFFDDYVKVVRKRPLGLRARHKLAVQIPASLALAWYASAQLGLSTAVHIPFGGPAIELGAIYPVFIVLMAIFMANAVNITDGADGLLAGSMVPSLTAYLLISMAAGQGGLALMCAALAAACLGFLFYNRYPARVIMGDTGSLALGGAVTALAVLTKTELLIALVGLTYVIEAMSVVLQVISFQTTGRRIFKMSPIHHHFELLGWPETRVVTMFWLGALLAGALGLLGMAGMGG